MMASSKTMCSSHQQHKSNSGILLYDEEIILIPNMTRCSIHADFFDSRCSECKKEYNEMKGIPDNVISGSSVIRNNPILHKKYKEFTELRAKKLYEELIIQYLKGSNEAEAAEKARSIIRKQCKIRGMPYWSWI
jgi:hypothetical protein